VRASSTVETPAVSPGDIVRVRLSCYLYDHGRWVDLGLEVVSVDGTQIVVKRPGAKHTEQWTISIVDLTTGKGRGTSRNSQRRYAARGKPLP
jgi:hypothetical protein